MTITKKHAVSLMLSIGYLLSNQCLENTPEDSRGCIESSPFTDAGLTRLPKLFPVLSIQYPLCLQDQDQGVEINICSFTYTSQQLSGLGIIMPSVIREHRDNMQTTFQEDTKITAH